MTDDTEDRAAIAAANRAAMPETAATVDAFRQVFGAVRVAWAEEGGQRVGRAPELNPRSMNADEWAHYIKTGQRPARDTEPAGEWPK